MLVRALLLCLPLALPAEAMDVQDVVGLVQAGVGDDTIMAIIRKTGAVFPLSAKERQKLSAAGVSERLIAFMMNPSAVPLPPTQTDLPASSKRRTSPPSGEPAGPSVYAPPPQVQSGTAGPSQSRTPGHKEPWQGDRQGTSSQPTGQSLAGQSQGSVSHPQVVEIPSAQLPAEGERQTLTAIPPQGQEGIKEQPALSREAMVTITVTDREGAYITDLGKEDVRLYEDGIPREILSLTPDQHTPVSVGILLDTSSSMIDKLAEAEDGLRHLVNTLRPEDEVFLFEFNKTPRLIQDFTSDRATLIQVLGTLRANGSTALYEVIAAAIRKIKDGRHRKKAMLLITDGNDTASRLSLGQVMELAKRSDVLMYSLGIGHGERGSFGHLNVGWPGDEVDVAALQALSGATGGTTFIIQGAHVVDGIDVIDQACQRIAAELRLQYTLRYLSRSTAAGVWHDLRIESPRRDLNVRARSGSYGE
jgi:Ca-activated chloride channel family protein